LIIELSGWKGLAKIMIELFFQQIKDYFLKKFKLVLSFFQAGRILPLADSSKGFFNTFQYESS